MKLSDLDRRILDLLCWQPMSNAEVALALEVERTTAHRALGKLMKGGLVKNQKYDQPLQGFFSTPGRYVLAAKQPTIDPAWLAWNDHSIENTAAGILATEDFSAMPILADMLEEAGCEDAYLLNHLRQEQRHSPRCWALRLLSRPE